MPAPHPLPHPSPNLQPKPNNGHANSFQPGTPPLQTNYLNSISRARVCLAVCPNVSLLHFRNDCAWLGLSSPIHLIVSLLEHMLLYLVMTIFEYLLSKQQKELNIQSTVVTIRTTIFRASGNYMHHNVQRTVVLYAPQCSEHSGNYMQHNVQGTVVTICTTMFMAQW